MNKKIFILAFSLLCSINIYCQNSNYISDEYGVICVPVNDSTIVYNTKKGEKHEIRLNQISFADGEKALVDYLKKEYYKPRPGDDDYTYRVFFLILFNSKLKIKEVRGAILPFNQYPESKKERIEQYTKGLKETKNRWKKKSKQKWYVYSFSFATD